MQNDEIAYQVYKTYDYSKFKTLKGNREISKANLGKLLRSFDSRTLITIIIVNKNLEIIDGQHRFETCKIRRLPVYYIIVSDYGLEEVQIYNSTMKKWGKRDYMDSYAEVGIKSYIELKEFMTAFPEFSLHVAESIVTGNSRGAKTTTKTIDGKPYGLHVNKFYSGDLVIKDIALAYKTAREILKFKPHFEHFNSPNFAKAILILLGKEGYDNNEMVYKVSLNKDMMYKCNSVASYLDILERVYNYRRRDKVNLRF